MIGGVGARVKSAWSQAAPDMCDLGREATPRPAIARTAIGKRLQAFPRALCCAGGRERIRPVVQGGFPTAVGSLLSFALPASGDPAQSQEALHYTCGAHS